MITVYIYEYIFLFNGEGISNHLHQHSVKLLDCLLVRMTVDFHELVLSYILDKERRDKEERSKERNPRGLYYKTFYSRNLQIFIIS
jgi:hypothetical protein